MIYYLYNEYLQKSGYKGTVLDGDKMHLEETIMKFTKLMVFALVLVMLISAFVACNNEPDETTTNVPETTTQPAPKDTTEPATTECTHIGSWKRTYKDKEATCTEEGYIERECRSCGEISQEPTPKLEHAYNVSVSADGKYSKKVCSACNEIVVVDENGNAVADYSNISFPVFATDFDNVASLEDLNKLFDGFSAVLDGTFGNIVKDPNGNRYVNVPTGNYGVNKNGRFELVDANKVLAGGFVLKFAAHYSYSSFPLAKTPLLTWIVDGTNHVLLSVDKDGKLYNSEDQVIGTCAWKGWDNFEVAVKADGTYTVSQNGNTIGSGKTATAVNTSSALKFFDNSSEFEAYLDNVALYK